jgi:transposase
MKAISLDLRERILSAVAQGQPLQTTARRFAVGFSTVRRLVIRSAQTGSIAPRPIPGRVRKIGRTDEALLTTRLESASDALLEDHCAWWYEQTGQTVSKTTMGRAIRRLGWTRKKRR